MFKNSCLESYEIPSVNAKEFLTSKVSLRSKYEESRETIEAKREVIYMIIISLFHSKSF